MEDSALIIKLQEHINWIVKEVAHIVLSLGLKLKSAKLWDLLFKSKKKKKRESKRNEKAIC